MREASLHEEIESIRRGGEAQLAKLALLAELDFEVGENGDVRTKKLKARLLDFVLFSLRSFATALGSSYEVKKGDDWHRARRAVEIRDRLTHPKTADDFIVSDDDLECVHFAKDWFHAQLLHMGGFKRIV